MMCEKCWTDAYDFGQSDQVENYRRLLAERKDRPCSPRDQAGQWWDETSQCDTRLARSGTAGRGSDE